MKIYHKDGSIKKIETCCTGIGVVLLSNIFSFKNGKLYYFRPGIQEQTHIKQCLICDTKIEVIEL